MEAYSEVPDWSVEMADYEAHLLIAAVLLHGPVDVLVTLQALHLESNPLIHEIGIGLTILVKATALLGLVITYHLAAGHPRRWVPPAILTGLGLLLILPNIPILYLYG